MFTIFKTNSMKEGARYIARCLGQTDPARLDVGHIVIVPDRASSEAEKEVLRALGGTFNVEVLTFRRLANAVLESKYRYMSKQTGIIALTGIVEDVKNQLTCYTKAYSSAGFIRNVYDTISAFKYCRITPEMLMREDYHPSVRSKMKDLSLIYSCYRDFTEERYVDSADKLDMLAQEAKDSSKIKDSYFYLYDFDNLTKQQLRVIEQLARVSKGVTLACCTGKNDGDRYLYTDEIYNGVVNMLKQASIAYNVVESRNYVSGFTRQIGENLFRYHKVKPVENNGFLTVFEGGSRVQEVYSLACAIQRYVRRGHRYRDIYVVTSDITKYKNAVSTIFEQFDIPYFCDSPTSLAQHVYAQFICDFLSSRNNLRLDKVLNWVKNPLFSLDNGDVWYFENFCLKYNVKYDYSRFRVGTADKLYPRASNFRAKVQDLIEQVKLPATATVLQYVAVVRQLIHCAALRENNNLFAERQREEGLLFQCRVTEQAEQKTEEILVQLEEVSGQRVCSDEQFISMLTTALTSVNISVLPVYSDCVVFANMAKARKHDIGFLALLGANHSEMPIIKGDCNLLNDENIKTLAEMGIDLEPQIFVENKRERFSLFQLLLEPSDKLYVSYSLTDGKDKLVPSNFVQQLMRMFSEKGKPVSLSAADEQVYTDKQAVSKLVFNKRRLQDRQPVHMPLYKALYGHFADKVDGFMFVKEGRKLYVSSGRQLFLSANTTTASKITEFFKCPYRFFISYGLKAKPRQVADVQASYIGDILHAVLEKYVGAVDLSESDEVTAKRADVIFDKVMQDDFFSALASDVTVTHILHQLRQECRRMCSVVKHQLAQSDFTNFATELEFGVKGPLPPVRIPFDGDEFYLVGKIDRVDVLGDDFVVVDYKSGNSAASYSETSLYYGLKLQLPIYVKSVESNLHKNPVGFYYFKMHNDFGKGEQEPLYVWNGRTVKDKDKIMALDRTLREGKSKRLKISLKKDGEIKESVSVVTEGELHAQVRYAEMLIASAGRCMRDGYVAVSPSDGACDYCDYRSICDYGDVYTYDQRDTHSYVKAEKIEEVTQ